jgi:predicted phosphoribosyltransferase
VTTFADRRDAGRQLAARLTTYRDDPRVLVLALPRGGVPVAAEIAEALRVPLDVLVVRKLGLPGHEELAMGAVASGDAIVLVPETITQFGVSSHLIARTVERERSELERREHAYRGGRPFPSLEGRIAILVDDGVATGATMQVAVDAIRTRGPLKVVVAAPLMSREAHAMLRRTADEVAVVSLPFPFYGVGMHYDDFSQTTDDEVRSLLEPAARDPAHPWGTRIPEFQ